MGFFSKIRNAVSGYVMEMGIDQGINEFGISSDEFDSHILPCFDSNYALQHVEALLAEIGQDNYYVERTPLAYEISFRFEGNVFATHIFHHYARALHVCLFVKASENDPVRLAEFSNNLNKTDMAHQVGIGQDDEGNWNFKIQHIILFIPSLGGLDYLKSRLRNMVAYSQKIASLQLPSANDWKESLPSSLGSNVKTADDVLFPQDPDNVWKKYARRKVLSETTNEIHLAPITLLGPGSQVGFGQRTFMISDSSVDKEEIIIYKDSPCIYTLSVILNNHIHSEEAVRKICNEWNCKIAFTLCTLTWEQIGENNYRITMRMNVMAAEDGNTNTDVDIFVTYQKYIAYLNASFR